MNIARCIVLIALAVNAASCIAIIGRDEAVVNLVRQQAVVDDTEATPAAIAPRLRRDDIVVTRMVPEYYGLRRLRIER